MLCLDMPGTGESPVKVDVAAEKMYSEAIDYLLTRKDVDGKRLAGIGVSWGGYWSAILGFTEKARLHGTVVQGGPVNNYFEREWQSKALGTREYLFDLFPARAGVYGVSTPDDFFAYGPRMSLQERGFIGQPSAPMLLINGVKDTQVPIEDLSAATHRHREGGLGQSKGRPRRPRPRLVGRQDTQRRVCAVARPAAQRTKGCENEKAKLKPPLECFGVCLATKRRLR